MRTRCVRLTPLSTGRHVLAFMTEPAATVLLTPTSAAVLGCLQRSASAGQACELFVTKTAGRLADPAGTFDRHFQALEALRVKGSSQ